MLALIPIPPELEALDARCREWGASIRAHLPDGEIFSPAKGENILSRFPDSWIHLRRGTFHYLIENRIVRFFSAGCWIPLSAHGKNAQIFTDFSAEVEAFGRAEFAERLAADPALMQKVLEYAAMQEHIASWLCALQAQAPIKASVSLRPFAAGEVIICEGDKAQEAFEMVQGSASVTVRGREISTVRDGQIFGELSFFTDSNRFATVTAREDCLVQVMDKDVFLSLMQHRPQMVESLVRTLCHRLLEANSKGGS